MNSKRLKTFSEWIKRKQKFDETSMSDLVDPNKGFNPRMTAEPEGETYKQNPFFNNRERRDQGGYGKVVRTPSQFAGLQSVSGEGDSGQFVGYFDITPNEQQKSIQVESSRYFLNHLQQVFWKTQSKLQKAQGLWSNIPGSIGGEAIKNKDGQQVYRYPEFMLMLNNAFGQLGAILQHYIFNKNYQKAELIFIKEIITTLTGGFVAYTTSMMPAKMAPHPPTKSKEFIDKMLRGLVRDLNDQNKEKGISISYNPQDNTIQRL